MKKFSKILVIVLSLALLCGALVFAIGAEGKNVAEFNGTYYTTIEEALEAAEKAEREEGVIPTVKLVADCITDGALITAKDVNIDLGGYTLFGTDSTLFMLNLNCKVSIVGTGVINIPGALAYSTTTTKTPNFSVIGDAGTNGIKIVHSGVISLVTPSVSDNKLSNGKSNSIIHTVQGNYTFKNVDIVSTADIVKGMSDWGSMFYTRYDSEVGANFSFDSVKFVGPTVTDSSTKALFNIEAKGTLTIENSYFLAALNSFRVVGAQMDNPTDIVVSVENSEIYANGTITSSGARLYLVEAMPGIENPSKVWAATGEGTYMIGTVKFKNSTVGASTRVILGGDDVAGIRANSKVVLEKTTIKMLGTIGSDSKFMMTRNIPVELDAESRMYIIGENIGTEGSVDSEGNIVDSCLTLSVGSRLSNKLALTKTASGKTVNKINVPANTSLVYDPAGDAAYPWVVVSNSDTTHSSLPTPDFSIDTNFDGFRPTMGWAERKVITVTYIDENRANVVTYNPNKGTDGKQEPYSDSEFIKKYITDKGYIYYCKETLDKKTEDVKEDGVKVGTKTTETVQFFYEISDADVNVAYDRVLIGRDCSATLNYSSLGAKAQKDQHWDIKAGSVYEVNDNGNTYFQYCVTPDPSNPDAETRVLGTDPFMVFGTQNNKAGSPTRPVGAGDSVNPQRKVIVAELDFGTDSSKGYPAFNFSTQARYDEDKGAGSFLMFGFDVNGNIVTELYENKEALGGGDKGPQSVKEKIEEALNLNYGEWNRLSIVGYSDEPVITTVDGKEYRKGDGGVAYVYINGKYVGCTYLYDKGVDVKSHSVIQFRGIRVNVSKTASQKVGSTVCIDNVSVRAYTDCEFSAAGSSNPGKEYITKAPALAYVSNPYSVKGIRYSDINEAIKAANAQGTAVELASDVISAVKVTEPGLVYTNGYNLTTTSDSMASFPISVDGKVVCYEFNAKYNDVILTYYWYINDDISKINDPSIWEAANIDKYITSTTVKMGDTPVAPKTFEKVYTETSIGTVAAQIAWLDINTGVQTESMDLPALTMAYYLSYKSVGGFFIPVFGEVKSNYTSYVKNGAVVKSLQFNNGETNTAYKELKNGDTLVLCADMTLTSQNTYNMGDTAESSFAGVTLDNDYTEAEITKMRASAMKIAVDLNGYSILNYSTSKHRVATLRNNVDMSFYSSRPGALIESFYAEGTSVRAQRMFAIYSGSDSETRNHNAHLSIGKYEMADGTVIPGSNMTLSGSVILEGWTGDNSTSLTMDGVLAIRNVNESTGAVMTRFFDGRINVLNTTLIIPKYDKNNGYAVDMKSYYTSNNMPSDANDPNSGRTSGYENKIFTPLVYFADSTIITLGGNNGNVVANNGDGTGVCLVFKNVVTNGRLNPSNGKRARVYGGSFAKTFAFGTSHLITSADSAVNSVLGNEIPSGLKVINNANIPMMIPDEHSEDGVLSIRVATGADGNGNITFETYSYASANYTGEGFSSTGTKTLLPYLSSGTACADDYVSVTFKGIGNNSDYVVDYVKGSTVSPYTAKTFEGPFYNFVHDGTWDKELPVSIQEDIVLTPGYTTVSAIEDVKTNVSISDDIGVGLFIPVEYKTLVSVYNGNTKLEFEEGTFTVDGKTYAKVIAYKLASDMDDDVVFTIVATDGDVTIEADYKFNLADYINTVLTGGSYTALNKNLAYAVADYVNEAVKYFDGAASEALSEIVVNPDYEQYKDTVEYTYDNVITNSNLGDVFEYATVCLAGKPTFVFGLLGGVECTVEITAGGATETFVVEDQKILEFTGLYAYNFDSEITIVVKVEDEEVASGTYNLETFVNYHVENSTVNDESEACAELVKAFYRYVMSAKACVSAA